MINRFVFLCAIAAFTVGVASAHPKHKHETIRENAGYEPSQELGVNLDQCANTGPTSAANCNGQSARIFCALKFPSGGKWKVDTVEFKTRRIATNDNVWWYENKEGGGFKLVRHPHDGHKDILSHVTCKLERTIVKDVPHDHPEN